MPFVEDINSRPLDNFDHNRREFYAPPSEQILEGNREVAIAPHIQEQILQPLQVYTPNSIPSQALGTYDTGNAGTTNTGNAGSSIRFWAGATFENRETAPFRVDQDGNLIATSATISGTITATAIDIGGSDTTSFHVDVDGNMWLGAATFAAAPFKVSNTGDMTANSATIAGYVLVSKGAFGGNGSDGPLNISSGTIVIDCAGAPVVIKNYTLVSITGTGKLSFINPNPNGTYALLKSQGGYTLTSSQAPMIDYSAMGAAGGASVSGLNLAQVGNAGSDGYSPIFKTNKGIAAANINVAGTGGAIATTFYGNVGQELNNYLLSFVGAGGASGSLNNQATGNKTGTSGIGGRGGGGLILECGGAWNFTTIGGISVAGQNGGDGVLQDILNDRAGGGGGGAGGFFLALYNTLTANSGTVTVSGGTGGKHAGANVNAWGGGGAGSATNAGTNGTTGVGDGVKDAGDGGAGLSNIIQNTLFA